MKQPCVYEPAELRCAETVIVTTNHLGASMLAADGVSYGDSGKDAQYLANVSGLRVVGLDRPHTGNGSHYSPFYARVMVKQPEIVAAAWANQFPAVLEELGAKRVELVGRSAGANLLLEVALLELLPVSGVATVDPVGVKAMSLLKGKARYLKYQAVTERSKQPQPDNENINIGELCNSLLPNEGSLTSLRRMIGRQLGDIKQYQHSWATDKTYWAMALIAAKFRQTTSLLSFAGHPLAAERSELEQIVAGYNGIANRQPGESAFEAGFIDGTTHSSFDNPRNYAAMYLHYRSLKDGGPEKASMQTVRSDLL